MVGVRCSFFFVCFVDRGMELRAWVSLVIKPTMCSGQTEDLQLELGRGKKPENAGRGMESEEAYLQLSGCLFCASDQAARNPSKGMSSGTPRFVSLLVWFSSSSLYKEFQLIERIEPRSIFFSLSICLFCFFNE